MNRLFTLFTLCVAVLLSGGCTKEDLSDCQTDVTLKLSYTLNPQDRDLWSETPSSASSSSTTALRGSWFRAVLWVRRRF